MRSAMVQNSDGLKTKHLSLTWFLNLFLLIFAVTLQCSLYMQRLEIYDCSARNYLNLSILRQLEHARNRQN